MGFESEGIEQGGTITQEGAEPEGTTAAPAADAVPAWAQQMQQGFQTFNSRLEEFAQRLPQAEEEPEEDEPLDLEALSREIGVDLADPETGEQNMEAQGRLMQELVRREIAAVRDADFARSEERRRDAEADALEERYPQLQSEETQTQLVELTEQFCNALGQPALAREPRMLELVLLAQTGSQAAAAERPASEQQDVHLERGGAAGPADAPTDGAAAKAIVGAVRGRQFRSNR